MTTDSLDMSTTEKNPAAHVLNEALGYAYPAALRAAVLLGVADHLADGPLDIAELADRTGTNSLALYRILRLLATKGIFREGEDGRFRLTPSADVLRADAPNSARAAVIMITEDLFWLPAVDLTDSVRDGTPPFVRRFGRTFFDYIRENPAAGAMFDAGIASFTSGSNELVASSYDFPESGLLVDVGGGYGGFLLAALRASPGLRGVLFDHESISGGHTLGELGADDRWEFIEGDFFGSVPTGGDLYTLKYILHDWSDEECVWILENCRRAMAAGGRVLVIDAVVPPGNDPHPAKEIDVFMMTLATGRERTKAEFASLFAAAGLRLVKVIPTPGPLSIIESVAA